MNAHWRALHNLPMRKRELNAKFDRPRTNIREIFSAKTWSETAPKKRKQGRNARPGGPCNKGVYVVEKRDKESVFRLPLWDGEMECD